VFYLSGCGFINLATKEQDSSWTSQWERQKLEKYRDCMGLTKDEIDAKLGKPKVVDYNVKYFIPEVDPKTKLWKHEFADERWGYEYHTGINKLFGDNWWIYFYFKDAKVIKVDAR
jgi:hypothetical protein